MLFKQPQKAEQIASLVNGQLLGNRASPILKISDLKDADNDSLCFAKERLHPRVKELIKNQPFGLMLLPKETDIGDLASQLNDRAIVLTGDPQRAIISLIPLLESFSEAISPNTISDKADIHPTAKIGNNVTIGSFTWIGPNVEISDNVVIFSHVALYPNVKIGTGSVIHSGAVVRQGCKLGAYCLVQNGAIIGADGFGYLPDKELGLKMVPQIGVVDVGNHVDIGANSCVDRATLGRTLIADGVKIDNLVQVGHNVRIGKFSIICGQSAIAGSSEIGSQVTLAGQVGVSGHIKINDKIRVGAKSGVISNLEKEGDYVGFPAIPSAEWRGFVKFLKKLNRKSDLAE
ncbi:MAG TPA: UDP-3-O-(3-hydroxymyristoyl)glucosamine N-acyltransferase [Oligoflexia bacterium]|nr:UDP-3-O-(3-hydroxymyristoyl)glucosamine N-acyltransferase [Oligoflexia bacterium]HMP27502.1 UDP-3-O-(3-hydroxymyristoyl)glucosamine N-acyltransferase [Oligoflexia bacterium]